MNSDAQRAKPARRLVNIVRADRPQDTKRARNDKADGAAPQAAKRQRVSDQEELTSDNDISPQVTSATRAAYDREAVNAKPQDDDEDEDEDEEVKPLAPAQAAIKARLDRLPDLAREVAAQTLVPEGLLPAQLLVQAVTGEENIESIQKAWSIVVRENKVALVTREDKEGQPHIYVQRQEAKRFLDTVSRKDADWRKGVRHHVYMALERKWDVQVFEIVDRHIAQVRQRAVPSPTPTASSVHAPVPTTTTTTSTAQPSTPTPVPTATGVQRLASQAAEPATQPPSLTPAHGPTPTTPMPMPTILDRALPSSKFVLNAEAELWIAKAREYAEPILRKRGLGHWEHASRVLAMFRILLRMTSAADERRPLELSVICAACLMLGLTDTEHASRELPLNHDPVFAHVDRLRVALGRPSLDTPLHLLARILRIHWMHPIPADHDRLAELAYVLDAHSLAHVNLAPAGLPPCDGVVCSRPGPVPLLTMGARTALSFMELFTTLLLNPFVSDKRR